MRDLQCTKESNERSAQEHLSTRSKVLVSTSTVQRYVTLCSRRCACSHQWATLCQDVRVSSRIELEHSFTLSHSIAALPFFSLSPCKFLIKNPFKNIANSLNPHILEPLNRNLRAYCRNCVLNKYWCSSNQVRYDHERSNANLVLKWLIWNKNWVNRTKTLFWAIAKFDFYGTNCHLFVTHLIVFIEMHLILL